MLWILLFSLSSSWAAGPDAKKLMRDCYDGNSAVACLQLSEKLAAGASATDHDRAILARHRACILGIQSACKSDTKPAPPGGKIEVMKVKRAEVDAELSNMASLLQSARLES